MEKSESMLLIIVGIVAIVGIVCMIVVAMPKAGMFYSANPATQNIVSGEDIIGNAMTVYCSNSCLNYYTSGIHTSTCCSTDYSKVKNIESSYSKLE